MKCHTLHGLRPWNTSRAETSGTNVQKSTTHNREGKREAIADIAALLAFDPEMDPVCCPITEPVWQRLSLWAQQHIQSPTLDERLASFVKAKDSAQQCIMQAMQQTRARFMHPGNNFASSFSGTFFVACSNVISRHGMLCS